VGKLGFDKARWQPQNPRWVVSLCIQASKYSSSYGCTLCSCLVTRIEQEWHSAGLGRKLHIPHEKKEQPKWLESEDLLSEVVWEDDNPLDFEEVPPDAEDDDDDDTTDDFEFED